LKVKRILSIVIVALIIELLVFNFFNVIHLLDKGLEKNKEYTLEQMEIMNWERSGNDIISGLDPMIIVDDVATVVKEINIECEVNNVIPYIDVFYTNNTYDQFNGELLIHHKQPTNTTATIKINQYVKDLRIDLGDEAGLKLSNIKVIINPTKIDFSLSRVIAMILIYFASIGLFYLQKNPEYKIK